MIIFGHYVTILLAKIIIWAPFSQSICAFYFCINPRIILSFRVGTSKNENIDHLGKETCAYQNDHISLLCSLTMSIALNLFCVYISVTQKEKIILKEERKSKKVKLLYVKSVLFF